MGWTACQQIFDLIMAVLKGKSLHVDVSECDFYEPDTVLDGKIDRGHVRGSCDFRKLRHAQTSRAGVFPLCGRPCVCHRHCRMPSAGPETSRL
jgi:hypothetical protein